MVRQTSWHERRTVVMSRRTESVVLYPQGPLPTQVRKETVQPREKQ